MPSFVTSGVGILGRFFNCAAEAMAVPLKFGFEPVKKNSLLQDCVNFINKHFTYFASLVASSFYKNLFYVLAVVAFLAELQDLSTLNFVDYVYIFLPMNMPLMHFVLSQFW